MTAKKRTEATGPRNVAQYRAAIKRLNEIANEKADEHNLCNLWDEIIEQVAGETGLELQPRKHIYDVQFEGFEMCNIVASAKPSSDELFGVLEAAVKAHWPGSYVSYHYAEPRRTN